MTKSRIHIFSDTHGRDISDLCKVDCDIRIIAGDLNHGPDRLGQIIGRPEVPTVVVLGNHDYYGSTIAKTQSIFREYSADNFHFLENKTMVIRGIRIIGATLWSDTNSSPEEAEEIKHSIADYDYIHSPSSSRYHEEFVTPADTTALFEFSTKYIEEQLKMSFDGPTIVVTHHLPCYNSVVLEWRSKNGNKAFYSNQDRLLVQPGLVYWIHGHTHHYLQYTMGSTIVLCNPYGYSAAKERTGFNPDCVITV